MLIDVRCRRAVEMGEHYADDIEIEDERSSALRAANEVVDYQADNFGTGIGIEATHLNASIAAANTVLSFGGTATPGVDIARYTAEHSQQAGALKAAQVAALRCIFGNPFRPVTINPAWLAWNDGTTVKIAQAIYDKRTFDRLLILADALEDSGCDDEYILNHCHQSSVHVRGCWVVDLILGKE
jgi:hypothetical protein